MVDVPENFQMDPQQFSQMQKSANPLMQYMRQPAIYLKLPSDGKFYPPGSLDMPKNREIPILPMSTKDEIAVNTPDALMNGSAVADMINSCCPNIKDPWSVPSVDIDSVLIAIRIASYGENMEYRSKCPKCSNEDNYEIDLRQFLDMPVDISGFDNAIEYKGMKIKIQPNNFESINNQNLETFEQQRLVSVMNNDKITEEDRQERFQQIFRKMTEYTVKNVANTIESITTPDGNTVTNREHINQFVAEGERQFYEAVRNAIEQAVKGVPEKTVTSTCSECSHKYEIPFTFDQANFFVSAS